MGGVIEEDGTVEFTETGAKPDTLEQTVKADAGSAGATETASGVITGVDKVWEAYKNLCSTFRSSNLPPQEDCYKEVIVNMLQMSYLNGGTRWAAVFQLGQLLPEHFLTCLKNIYGDTFEGTDIEDKIRAGTLEGKVPDEIAALFPELVSLSQLPSGGYSLGDLPSSHTESTLTLTSPYLLVLCASPQYKPFIAGGIELAINNQAFAGIDFDQEVDIIPTTHGKEKLTKYVAQYAKQIGQHKNLIPILQELNQIPIKERR